MELETFDQLTRKLVANIKNGDYSNRKSLDLIIKQLENLPPNEKDINSAYIEKIKTIIDGFSDIQGVLTDEQIETLIFALQWRSTKQSNNNINEFEQLIYQLTLDIQAGMYNTKSSLLIIMDQLDNLPDSEKNIYDQQITKIKTTIKGYRDKSDILTKRQKAALLFAMEGKIGKRKGRLPAHFFSNNNIIKLNDSERNPFHRDADNIIQNVNYYYSGISVNKQVPRFDEDDVITEATLLLLNKLTYNMMSSGITMCIVEYLEIVEMTLSSDDNKYQVFYNEIMNMLQKQGWIKNRGFQREPNKDDIVMALNDLIEKYM